jgi:hypothetical protein
MNIVLILCITLLFITLFISGNEYFTDIELPKIKIFILCYNEEVMLPHTIKHYNKYLPSSEITILDNESTDNSCKIAKSMGCKIKTVVSNKELNDPIFSFMRNQYWKNINDSWIIVIDMDEWLYITEKELLEEQQKGITILSTTGYNMLGESNTEDLKDIDLHKLTKGKADQYYSKTVCFKTNEITDINFGPGCHTSDPKGNVKFSNKIYILKHFDMLGVPFKINKTLNRFNRSVESRKVAFGSHYTNDINEITNIYNTFSKESYDIIDHYNKR